MDMLSMIYKKQGNVQNSDAVNIATFLYKYDITKDYVKLKKYRLEARCKKHVHHINKIICDYSEP